MGSLSYLTNPKKSLTNDGYKKVHNLSKKVSDDQFNKMVDAVNICRKIPMSKLLSEEFNKMFRSSGITLKNNETKNFIKVIRSLENRGVLLKQTIKKVSSQKGGFLSFLRPLMSVGYHWFTKHLLYKYINIKVSRSLGLTTAASATDGAIKKKMFGSEKISLIITNEEMEDIIIIVKSLQESSLLIKGVSETIKNEVKEEEGKFLCVLLGTTAAGLLGSLLAVKEVVRSGDGDIIASEGVIRASQDF